MSRPIVGWFGITGKDGPALQRHHASPFDWDVTDAGSGYGLVAAEQKGIAGGIGASSDGGDGGGTFNVEVDDRGESLAKVERLGGKTVVPLTEIANFGFTFGFFADLEGHVVGLSKGAVQ